MSRSGPCPALIAAGLLLLGLCGVVAAQPAVPWKPYRNAMLGIAISIPRNWRAAACDTGNAHGCIAFYAPATPGNDHPDAVLTIERQPGGVEKALQRHGLFAWENGHWVKHGHMGQDAARPIHGRDWRGLTATADCGLYDINGFHGSGGQCLTAILSHHPDQSLVFETDGAIPPAWVSGRMLSSLQFLDHPARKP